MSYKYHPNYYYFITYKTFLGEKIFINDIDKRIITNQIIKTQKDLKLNIIAFVVLSNHYHLLIKCTQPEIISKSLQLINGGGSKLINERTKINRSIWGDKFNRFVDEEKYLDVLTYIIGNPIKHGLVSDLNELSKYPFCSYTDAKDKYGESELNDLILKSQKFDFETAESWDKLYKSEKPTKVGYKLS